MRQNSTLRFDDEINNERVKREYDSKSNYDDYESLCRGEKTHVCIGYMYLLIGDRTKCPRTECPWLKLTRIRV